MVHNQIGNHFTGCGFQRYIAVLSSNDNNG